MDNIINIWHFLLYFSKKMTDTIVSIIYSINGRGDRIRTRTNSFGDCRATVDTTPLPESTSYYQSSTKISQEVFPDVARMS